MFTPTTFGSRRSRALPWLALLVALALPHAGLAAPRKDAGKDLSDLAATQFKEGKYLQAAELFERAFALNPEKLVRLRNAGRSFQEAGRVPYARLVFQRYLDLAPEGPDKAEVRERVARIDAAAQPVVIAKVEPPPAPAPQPLVISKPLAPRSRTLAWGLVGSGGAVLAGGAVWLVAVAQAQTRFDADVEGRHYQYADGGAKKTADASTLGTNRALAWTTTGIGVATLGYGLYQALRGEPASGESVSWSGALVPWAGADEAGLVAAARF